MFELVANNVWTRTSKQAIRQEREKWRQVVGSKALGLAVLPEPWTPPFLIVSTSLYREWAATPKAFDRHSVIAPTADVLNSFVNRQFAGADHGLIIRSSAVRESMSQRGAYQSLELPADFNEHAIIEAISQIFSAFAASKAQDELALVVQSRVHLSFRGHLSNERRVSKTENHWMWETESPKHEFGRFNSQRASASDFREPLECDGSRKPLLSLFRKIARCGLHPVPKTPS